MGHEVGTILTENPALDEARGSVLMRGGYQETVDVLELRRLSSKSS